MIRIILTSLMMLFSVVLYAGNSGNALKTDYFRSRLYDKDIERSEKIKAIDSLIKYADKKDIYSLCSDKAQMLYYAGDYRGCMKVYEKLREEVPADSLHWKFMADAEIGIMKFTLSNFRGALEDAYRILDTPKPDSLRYINLYAYLLLADFYGTAKNYSLAGKYIDLGIKELDAVRVGSKFPQSEKDRFYGVFYRCSASHFLNMEMTDEAYRELKKAESYPSDPDGKMSNYVTFADIAYLKGEKEMAEDYFMKALDVKTGNFNKAFVLIGYMNMLLDDGRAEDAFNLVSEYPDVVDKLTGSPLEPEYLEKVSRYYSIKGDKDNENETLKRIIALKDSIHEATVSWEVDELASRYETGRNKDIISSLEAKNRNKVWLVLAVGALGLLAAALAVAMWLRHRKSKKDAEILGNEIIDKELYHKKELRETADSLSIRNQELSSMTMYMARLNDALDSIKDIADNKKSAQDERLAQISAILKDLSRQDNIWEIFRTYFESVNQSFFNNLSSLHPDLTNGEERMCAFILMGLSNKEIAAMTNRSVRTVEVIKHNIRKKIAITEPTEIYLRRIATSG